eukprot:TRINITY_DN2210_c0_g1::TRINITY_DN2210_c0_g1_i1::g.6754::m.6754 TRINITY_DN2210_c0_g1::TRINITY_DN2210_c0_g1_i1::g.6754  ORF type:complete len:107 (+),score=-15.95,WBP-1/PF11669.3/0.0077 TRINITY_DN2210_c0_g1_i1:527-847(+)
MPQAVPQLLGNVRVIQSVLEPNTEFVCTRHIVLVSWSICGLSHGRQERELKGETEEREYQLGSYFVSVQDFGSMDCVFAYKFRCDYSPRRYEKESSFKRHYTRIHK